MPWQQAEGVVVNQLPVDELSRQLYINHNKRKGFAWVWLERVHPKKGCVPNPGVLVVRVRDEQEKEMLLATEPELFFTEPHYNGYPAVLVYLLAIDAGDLENLLRDAWRCQAPPELVRKMDQSRNHPAG